MDIHCADLALVVIAGKATSFCLHHSGAYSGQSYSHHSFSYQQTMRRKTAPVCCCVSNVQIPPRQQFFLVTALLLPFLILLDGKLPRSARHHTGLNSRIPAAINLALSNPELIQQNCRESRRKTTVLPALHTGSPKSPHRTQP